MPTGRITTLALAVGVAATLAGCGASADRRTSAPPVRLTGAHPCAREPGFTCATLAVPLDHAVQARGALRLEVGLQQVPRAPRGVLLFLTGGPGQPGVPFLARIESRLRRALAGYRLVMFDQRGTGAGALRCAQLQRAAGSSDLVVPPPGAVPACARTIGPARRYFTTPETVADIDALRAALGVPRLTLDGVSYGTFVAERYALRYPGSVAQLVLDSIVPQQGVDALYLASLQATARVLRSVCAAQRCGWDPARDLADVVRARHNGPALMNALVAESVALPAFPGVLQALHAARAGRSGPLDALLNGVRVGEAASADELSQGLHESTLCLDLAPPWDPAISTRGRAALLARLAGNLGPAAVFPYDRATAAGNGLAQGCVQWPATSPPSVSEGDPSGALPPVPTLLLSGERDLSTPLAWARAEAAHAPDGRLVAVPGAGHSVQLRARDPAVRALLAQFLGG
jgi:pimeloyl-ACP methyl ester carboxylesterase